MKGHTPTNLIFFLQSEQLFLPGLIILGQLVLSRKNRECSSLYFLERDQTEFFLQLLLEWPSIFVSCLQAQFQLSIHDQLWFNRYKNSFDKDEADQKFKSLSLFIFNKRKSSN